MEGPRKGKMKASPPAKVAAIPGVMYKGSGKDPAVNELMKKLKKGGKSAKRRLSFCRRMKGMKKKLTSKKTS